MCLLNPIGGGNAMPLFWCSWPYLITLAVIAILLVVWLRTILRIRRRVRQQPVEQRRSPLWLKPLFACWTVVTLFYLCEFCFAAFVDTTDAFNATNVSARWFQRHVEPYRNSDGFRDKREFPKGQSEKSSRIFMIGDSFTIAQGINRMDDRFTDLTEETLNQRREGDQKKVAVYNLGEFGWEVSVIDGVVQAFFQKGCRPDVVVYVYMLNDIEGYDPRTEEAITKIQQQQPQSILWTKTYFFNWMNFLWRQHQAKRTVEYFPHLADSYREQPWKGVQKKLDSMQRVCEANDSELRMVFFPFLHNLGPNYEFKHAHQQLAEWCETHDIRYLDLEPVLTPAAAEDLTVNRYDNHPNERCHAIVAKAICEKLLNDFPQE